MSAVEEARMARDEMDAAIRNYADALWKMQDELSESGDRNDCVLGDVLVVAHFTPLGRISTDLMGDVCPSPQYIMLNPRNLAPHTMHGLLVAAEELVHEDKDFTLDMMYPEDKEDDDA